MDAQIVDVTVHIDETLEHAQLEAVETKIRELEGVISVAFHDNKPNLKHLMVVEYVPNKVTSEQVLHCITEQGYHAELIGL